MQHTPAPIKVGRTRDGTVAYFVDLPPEALPPVLGRDLAAAWEAARDAAAAAQMSSSTRSGCAARSARAAARRSGPSVPA